MKTETVSKKLNELSDEEIINEVKTGSYEYYSEIVRRYNQRLYRIAVSYGLADDDCDDVIQLAYISAFEKINQFRQESKFSTWLTRILINECLMFKRRTKKFIPLNDKNSVTITPDDHQNPEIKFMEKEKKEILEKAILRLPEKYRGVYILKEVEGMTVDEVSLTLDLSKVNVKVRLYRAKSMLKEFIRDVTDVSNLFTFGNKRCDKINYNVMKYIRGKRSIGK